MFQTISRERQGTILPSVVFNIMMTETSNKDRSYNKTEYEILMFARRSLMWRQRRKLY
jgi:hypothetical protein